MDPARTPCPPDSGPDRAASSANGDSAAGTARPGHTVGRVVPDETLTFRVSAGTDGWVRACFLDQDRNAGEAGRSTGGIFQQRHFCAAASLCVCARILRTAEDSRPRLRRTNSSWLASSWPSRGTTSSSSGWASAQIEALGRTRREVFDVNLTAPADGQILERHVAVGQRFMKGDPLYQIANLDRVWVLADVYARDAALIASIRRAQVMIGRFSSDGSERRAGAVASQRRWANRKLRLEVKNQGRRLVPGMIVNVSLTVAAGSAMTLSVDAVIDSGDEEAGLCRDRSRAVSAPGGGNRLAGRRPCGDQRRTEGRRTGGHRRRLSARFGKPPEES